METQTFWINYNSDLQTFLAVKSWLRTHDIDHGETAMFIWCNATERMMTDMLIAMGNNVTGISFDISIHQSNGMPFSPVFAV